MTPTSAHFTLFYNDSNDVEYNVFYDASAVSEDLIIFHAGTKVSWPLSKLEWLRDEHGMCWW